MAQLKLTCLDKKDLEVVSTHLQDALVRVGDMSFLRPQKRFVLVVNRFDWAYANEHGNKKMQRHLCGVHFEGVEAVRAKNIALDQEDVILELLSVEFKSGEKPSGTISLKFAAGGEIELDVEYVEALLKDLGPKWGTRSRPEHGLEEE